MLSEKAQPFGSQPNGRAFFQPIDVPRFGLFPDAPQSAAMDSSHEQTCL